MSQGRPLFALEHGLSATDREALSKSIRASVDVGTPSPYPLPWIVHATEVGYRYSGEEYWQTFEEETPGWSVRGDRYSLRAFFRSFQKSYGGAEPRGPWAAHFSIICWPITHAILPRDLQKQLARILYEVRHSYSAELFESPSRLGELIAARSWSATSRFQNFAQEPQLVGQIAAALLLQGQSGTASLIHPATLSRISEDVDRERLGREWLRTARRSAETRVRIRGLTLAPSRPPTAVFGAEEARAELAALGIEPRLVLRRTDATRNTWEAWLEVPDLSHLLLRFPSAGDVLTGSRCIVAGSDGRPLARGSFLHGARRVLLASWPRSDEVLLRFDLSNSALESLLRTECLLRPGSRWLFRIASDGLAHESRGLRVRPGQRYILVTANGQAVSHHRVTPVEVKCIGVDAAFLDLPAGLTAEWEDALRQLGLAQARTLEVWPAGLGAVVWDGEGRGEWLASERPCLAIQSDHPLAAVDVSLGGPGGSTLELAPVIPGVPLFVELPDLTIGLHTVTLRARALPESTLETLGDLNVLMRIRDARPWSTGVSSQGPLAVAVDPLVPTLEQLWEGQCHIDIQGPATRSVRAVVSLFDRPDANATVVTTLPPLELPVSGDDWNAHFAKFFRITKPAQTNYDAARICQLEFIAGELGSFVVRCERSFTPLRWVVRAKRESTTLRLIDDSGETQQASVAKFHFDEPMTRRELDVSSQYDVSGCGGLYVAQRAEATIGVVAMPPIRDLKDLSCSPRIQASDHSPERVKEAMDVIALWRIGRPSGSSLSATNQKRVLRELTRHIMLLVCGERWAQAEQDAAEGRDSELTALKRAVSDRREEIGIAAAIAMDISSLSSASLKARVARLADLIVSFRLMPKDGAAGAVTGNALWLAELALRLGSDPAAVRPWAEKHATLGISRLSDSPTILRAARFLVLATERHVNSDVALDTPYAGWRW